MVLGVEEVVGVGVGEVVVVLELELLELLGILEECHTKVLVLFGVEIHQ